MTAVSLCYCHNMCHGFHSLAIARGVATSLLPLLLPWLVAVHHNQSICDGIIQVDSLLGRYQAAAVKTPPSQPAPQPVPSRVKVEEGARCFLVYNAALRYWQCGCAAWRYGQAVSESSGWLLWTQPGVVVTQATHSPWLLTVSTPPVPPSRLHRITTHSTPFPPRPLLQVCLPLCTSPFSRSSIRTSWFFNIRLRWTGRNKDGSAVYKCTNMYLKKSMYDISLAIEKTSALPEYHYFWFVAATRLHIISLLCGGGGGGGVGLGSVQSPWAAAMSGGWLAGWRNCSSW